MFSTLKKVPACDWLVSNSFLARPANPNMKTEIRILTGTIHVLRRPMRLKYSESTIGAHRSFIEKGQNAKLNVPWIEKPTFLAPRRIGMALVRP